MSDNPLEVTPERMQRIEARARHLWEAAGSPTYGNQQGAERPE